MRREDIEFAEKVFDDIYFMPCEYIDIFKRRLLMEWITERTTSDEAARQVFDLMTPESRDSAFEEILEDWVVHQGFDSINLFLDQCWTYLVFSPEAWGYEWFFCEDTRHLVRADVA